MDSTALLLKGDHVMIHRRVFMQLASAGAAGLILGCKSLSSTTEDSINDAILVNTLGSFHDGYGASRSGDTRTPLLLTTDNLIADAHASGLTALNLTVNSGERFADAEKAVQQSDEVIRRYQEDLLKVLSAADIHRAKAEKKIGIIYGFQNAAMVEDKAHNVDRFAEMGVRIIQLTYNKLNQLGGGALASGDPGITDFGREVIGRLNANRLIADLSHSGRQTCLDAAAASSQPIAITHTGCAALASVPRNKTDEELRLVASKGGYVGIYFMPFLAPGRSFGSEEVIAHIEHAVRICGEDQVGIGTDHGLANLGDMATVRQNYAATVNDRRAKGISAPGEDPDLLPYAHDLTGPNQFRDLARKLLQRGFSTTKVEKIMGGNFLRYAEAVWGS
jgi:membrane dipeptidase